MVVTNATAVVTPITQVPDATGVLQRPKDLAPVSVVVYFEESSPGEAFASVGIELKEPAYIQCEIADGPTFKNHSRVEVTIDGDSSPRGFWFVYGTPEYHRMGNEADHVDIYLSSEQFPNGT